MTGRYHWSLSSTNSEIIPRLRQAGTSDYVFVVNDQREAGTYVGQHGLVQDQGLPSSGTILLAGKNQFVYDLMARRQVPVQTAGNGLIWNVDLGPCEGNVFLATSRPIEQINIRGSEQVERGSEYPFEIQISDLQGNVVDAVIPVEVKIFDPHGRPAEFSGYHATEQGKLKLNLSIATNDTPGAWTIQVRELATGLSLRNSYFVVK